MKTSTGALSATGSGGALTHVLNPEGPDTRAILAVSGTFAGLTVVAEYKLSGGSAWYPLSLADRKTGVISSGSVAVTDNTATSWEVDCRGAASVRFYASAGTLTAVAAEISSGTLKEFGGVQPVVQVAATTAAAFAAGLTFSGATGANALAIPDNLADALNVKEGSNSYLKFVTTNLAELVVLGKELSLVNARCAPGASTAAAGSTTADATALPAGTSSVYPTTAADDTKGVRIDAADQVTGRVLFIGNGVANKILKVYAPSGGAINGGSADAAFSGASGKGVIVVCLSGAGNTWLAW